MLAVCPPLVMLFSIDRHRPLVSCDAGQRTKPSSGTVGLLTWNYNPCHEGALKCPSKVNATCSTRPTLRTLAEFVVFIHGCRFVNPRHEGRQWTPSRSR